MSGKDRPTQPESEQAIETAIKLAIQELVKADQSVASTYFGFDDTEPRGHGEREEAAGEKSGMSASGFRTPLSSGISHREAIIATIAVALFKVVNPFSQASCAEVIERLWPLRRNKKESAPAMKARTTESLSALLGDSQVPQVPEIVIATVRPIGTKTKHIVGFISQKFTPKNYLFEEIELHKLISQAHNARTGETLDGLDGYKKIRKLMESGDRLRCSEGNAAVAALAIHEITARRRKNAKKLDGKRGVIYLITHLMHEAEVKLLRQTYGSRFFLLGISQERDQRRKNLKVDKVGKGIVDKEDWDPDDNVDTIKTPSYADMLIDIDAGLYPTSQDITSGNLSVSNTFHLADMFLTTERVRAEAAIGRFVDQIFSDPFEVLTKDETAMAIAYTAALRSSALARRVGAAIMHPDGSLISIGWNDPVAKGGLTYPAHGQDFREHQDEAEGDPSDTNRLESIALFLNRLGSKKAREALASLAIPDDLSAELQRFLDAAASLPHASTRLISGLAALPPISGARLLNLIEFGRCVHAEMHAITNAARRGVSTQNADMYVTTFPCHECARNIIAAGITRVVFLEPYQKSLARDLYKFEATFFTAPPKETATGETATTVTFAPYEGFAPSASERLLSWEARKPSIRELAKNPTLNAGRPYEPDERLRDSVRGYKLRQRDNGEVNPIYEYRIRLNEHAAIEQYPFVLSLD